MPLPVRASPKSSMSVSTVSRMPVETNISDLVTKATKTLKKFKSDKASSLSAGVQNRIKDLRKTLQEIQLIDEREQKKLSTLQKSFIKIQERNANCKEQLETYKDHIRQCLANIPSTNHRRCHIQALFEHAGILKQAAYADSFSPPSHNTTEKNGPSVSAPSQANSTTHTESKRPPSSLHSTRL